jgi:Ser/Thr protein kinase RdoA (MazF antagonist)
MPTTMDTRPQPDPTPGGSSLYTHWQEVLQSHWDIDAQLTRLDGEYDLNFLAVGDGAHILKVMRAGCEPAFVDMQCRAFEHIRARASNAPGSGAIPIPEVVRTTSGDLHATVADEAGQPRIVWLMTKLPGIRYASWQPHTPDLSYRIGNAIGAMDRALAEFEHPSLARSFKWKLTEALWITDRYGDVLAPSRHAILDRTVEEFLSVRDALNALPSVAIHNDVNDHNILVDGSLLEHARVTGLIDLGDMCAAPRVCDLAIAGAYMVLNDSEPEATLSSLAAGYHAAYPLTPPEVELIWPLLRMRLAVSVVNSALMAIDNPEDPYVVISQESAWDFLESERVSPGLIGPRLRAACGLPVTDTANGVVAWLDDMRGSFAPVLGCDLSAAPMGSLSVESSTTPQDPFSITPVEAANLGAEFGANGSIWLGYYGEPRLVYTEQAFRGGSRKIDNRRTVHLGIDVFAAAGTPVHAPLEATVAFTGIRAAYLDYGGVVILRHETPNGDAFVTLYGHL